MFLTNKMRDFYSVKSCSINLRRRFTAKTTASATLRERIKDLLGRTLVLVWFLAACLTPLGVMAVEKGATAPGFTLKDIAGKEVRLEDFRGQTVLLKLATTWCPSCKGLTAEINKVGDFLQEHDVAVLEVFVQDSPVMVERYLKDTNHPMTYRALLDDGQAYRGYNVYVIPRLLVIDAEQQVQFDSGGREVSADQIVELVEALPALKASEGGAQKQ